ncbi:MAG: SRPBCC family protein [Solirubrobacterales bacterium]
MTARGEQLVLELKRVFPAARPRLYQLLTEPEELARWWGPRGFTTPELEWDLRVGGRYRLTMQPPDGDAFHLTGEFREVEPLSELTYSFRWEEPDPDDRETLVRLSLADLDGSTELSLSQGPFATEARLDLHRNGWSDSLDKLDEVLSAEG